MKRLIFLCITALLLMSTASAKTQSADGVDKIRLPVLMYHMVKPSGAGKDSITPWEFESDLKFLKENGYETVTIDDVTAHIDGLRNLPPKPVILSFDDGYYNNYKYVFPLLKEYNAKIVLSVIVKATDMFTRRPSSNENFAHITWGQLNEMIDAGFVDIQNHSYDLHSRQNGRIGCDRKRSETFTEYEALFGDDIALSQAMIYLMTGKTPQAFAYPYGKYSDDAESVLEKHGIRVTLSCEYGMNNITKSANPNIQNLKRICRAHNQSAEKLLSAA